MVHLLPDRTSSRLRVFREEEFEDGEEPTQPGLLARPFGTLDQPRVPPPLPPAPTEVDPFDQTDVSLAARVRAARPTQPLPLPRLPRR